MKRKMNQGVFLSVLRLQFSSFHRRKILLLLTVPNAQVQKSMILCSFYVKIQLGHTVPFCEKGDQGKVFYEC